MPAAYAQTNLQLQTQLVELGYSVDDRKYFARSYGLAADLFSGQYRGSGKPFVAHLVGTASILGRTKASRAVMAAGLLHAAYEQGDFGLGLWGRHADKRKELVRVLGAEAEEHVERYFRLRWTDDVIAGLPARAAILSPLDQRVVLIRLANELEDYLDGGVLFCANSAARVARMARVANDHLVLARRLGHPDLADELSQAFAMNAAGSIPSGLRSKSGHSRLRIPRSCRRRYVSILRSLLASR
jgi:(p)ppGpp synthase/HD superfamily hydrolase